MSDKVFHTSDTGGRKEVKGAAYHLLPWRVLYRVAKLFAKGAQKYGERNWEKGFPWSLSHSALHRHLSIWWEGLENFDRETGAHHLDAVIFHAMVLRQFVEDYPEGDDRPSLVPQTDEGTDTPPDPPKAKDGAPVGLPKDVGLLLCHAQHKQTEAICVLLAEHLGPHKTRQGHTFLYRHLPGDADGIY